MLCTGDSYGFYNVRPRPKVDLSGVVIENPQIDDFDLNGADLIESVLVDGHIINTNFSGVNISRSIFYKVRMKNVDFSGARGVPTVTLIECTGINNVRWSTGDKRQKTSAPKNWSTREYIKYLSKTGGAVPFWIDRDL